MDLPKIELFERNNGKGSFPWFRTLPADECEVARTNLARSLQLGPMAGEERILHSILELQASRRRNVDKTFDLAAELTDEGVEPSRNILINWYRFDRIDEMNLFDLSQNLEAIWYPRADDIEIFDSTFSWIASIFYFSVFEFYRLRVPQSNFCGSSELRRTILPPGNSEGV